MIDQTISASYLFSSTNVQDPGTLSAEEGISFTAWFKALFDSNSEGIEGTIIRLALWHDLLAQLIESSSAQDPRHPSSYYDYRLALSPKRSGQSLTVMSLTMEYHILPARYSTGPCSTL
jgi:hypothetical protein